MLYAIYPGSVTTRDGEVQTFTYEELIALYDLDAEDCVLGTTITEIQKLYYIHLKPRVDGFYDPLLKDRVDLGDEIKWGPDFDGRKRFTMETNFDTLYAEQRAEEQR